MSFPTLGNNDIFAKYSFLVEIGQNASVGADKVKRDFVVLSWALSHALAVMQLLLSPTICPRVPCPWLNVRSIDAESYFNLSLSQLVDAALHKAKSKLPPFSGTNIRYFSSQDYIQWCAVRDKTSDCKEQLQVR